MAKLPTGTVTFFFTDIEASTRLLQHVGDEVGAQVFADHRRLLRSAFEAAGGYEYQDQSESFLIVFQSAKAAVLAAVAAQRAIATHPWPGGTMLRVRMGLHTGEPVVAADGYVGLDVHRAARICAAGHGGQILLSERTSALVEGDFTNGVRLKDLGEHRLKDLAQPERVFQVLIHDLPADFPPLKSLDILTTNLPSLQLTSFVGREREMAEIKKLLSTARLVTLIGPGGAGKTRLSLQVAADLLEGFPQGVWMAELAPFSDPALVVQTVATVFGVREMPGRALLDTLIDYLRPREVLLVLDNCEHLVEASARLADRLLRACPKLRILATSREGLGTTGEVTYRVPPLSRPDPKRPASLEQLTQFEATRLFMERAVLSNPAFAVTGGNAPALIQVCHRLDGIPLAIELAAARVKVLSVEQIAQRLDDRFRLLTGGSRVGLPHHRTLRAAVEWSYDLLPEEEQVLFRHLSVFAGGFTLEAAEAVCSGDGIRSDDVLDLLAHLIDKSLVMTEGLDGDIRYRLLETLRHYGHERLRESGEADDVRRRHLDWHLDLAERAEPELRGPDQVVWLERLDIDYDDLRAALEWARADGTAPEHWIRLAWALYRFWSLRGYLREGREWLEQAASTDGASLLLRAKAAYGAGMLAFHQGDFGQAEALSTQSLAHYRECGETFGVALALNTLGRVAQNRGDYGHATLLLEEGLALSRQSGSKWALAQTLNTLGITARNQRDYGRAKTLLEESQSLWRELGDRWGLAFSLGSLGAVARFQGDYDRARVLHEESIALRRQLGDKFTLAISLNSLGAVLLDQGDYDRARELFDECLVLCRELGNKLDAAAALGNLGIVAYKQEDYARAEALLKESLVLWKELDHKQAITAALSELGMVALSRGDHQHAAALYRESLDLAAEQGDRLGVAKCLAGLAGGAAAQGRYALAARLFGAAEALRESIGAPMPVSDRVRYDRYVASVRANLTGEDLAAAWARGRALSLDEAIREALDYHDLLSSGSAARQGGT